MAQNILITNNFTNGVTDVNGVIPDINGVITIETGNITESTNANFVSDVQLTVLGSTSGTNTGDETATSKQTFTDALTVSPAPLDTMMIQVTDPASTTVKKFSWSNFKTYLTTYFDTVYKRITYYDTGSVISFTYDVVWNTPESPSTANLTDNLTGAKIGLVQKIYHNKAVEPTYPAGWVKMGTGTYTNGVLNVIFAEWVSGTRVEYWITKPA
jgi:hypothetical protein